VYVWHKRWNRSRTLPYGQNGRVDERGFGRRYLRNDWRRRRAWGWSDGSNSFDCIRRSNGDLIKIFDVGRRYRYSWLPLVGVESPD